MRSDTSSTPSPPALFWARRKPWVLNTAAATLAFATYFCMYAFRKPFAVGEFAGDGFWGLDLKTTLVTSQVLGYTLSKYLGVKWVSEASRRARLPLLLGLIAAAELALLAVPLLPRRLTFLALFMNGLPLGMVWGLVVRSLEGRRASDLLLAALSSSFIVASGVVKDVGREVLSWGASEPWMPFLTGLLFIVPLTASAALLNTLPDPDSSDVAARAARVPLDGPARRAFFFAYWPGLLPLVLAYFVLTAFRDFRDNYGIELFRELGYGEEPALFTQTELPIAVLVLVAMAALTLVRERRRALISVFAVMAVGFGVMGGATWALAMGAISGQSWMLVIGLGAYLAYVPFGSFLFDHIMANTQTIGTAVFAINLFDAVGYTGSVALQLGRDLFAGQWSRLEFFTAVTQALSLFGVGAVVVSAFYFCGSGLMAPNKMAQAHPKEVGLR